MAKITGGILGRPAGKTAGVVFGAARSRTGKVVTAREKVIPSNPRSVAQTLQRGKFLDCLYVARHWTATMWQEDWNRSIGQLPGFQGVMSILLDNIDGSYDFSAPAATPLGNLHFPDTFSVAQGASSDELDFTYSAELGLNGTVNDVMKVAACEVSRSGTGIHHSVFSGSFALRSGSPASLDCEVTATDVLYVAWLIGAGAAEGLITPAVWGIQTTGA